MLTKQDFLFIFNAQTQRCSTPSNDFTDQIPPSESSQDNAWKSQAKPLLRVFCQFTRISNKRLHRDWAKGVAETTDTYIIVPGQKVT